VPPFVLQTVVENAVKYGIATREEGGTVSISATAGEGGLVLRVTNPGTIGAGGSSVGVGLTNARARLRLLFGDRARLTLRQAGDALVVAEVAVPAAARPSDSPVSST
jgi:LytS/YehU family sensor histidine kinase